MENPPVDQLAAPAPQDPIPDPIELFLNNNVYSLTYWANMFIVKVIKKDPLAWATAEFAGDYQQMQVAAQAIKNLAKYNSSYAGAVYTAAKNADPSWDGNAADSAKQYFDDLNDAIRNQVGPLKDIAQDIDTFALSSYYVAQGVSFLIQGIIDTAIIAIIKEAAAAAAASTGVGAGAAAALQASVVADMMRMIALWNQVLTKYATFATAGEVAIAGILNGVASVRSKEFPPLSVGTYDHPGA
ncbi:hypothetical protein IU485_08945 [Nocardia cyriacigeorgica]|uniref:hypothetical protein n=1 Tax=Nocardia cyriacigeorgica TaxID=135487 RepID=UPI0018958F08|nr:hypothetical protein [Nocardia cyriacigeorgica]MBF6081481.1 hypothetical protein [Nocardia cyriacigeorgica]